MVFTICHAFAQNIVTGILLEDGTLKPISAAKIRLFNTDKKSSSSSNGEFKITGFADGNYVLEITKQDYQIQKFSISCTGTPIDLGSILMSRTLQSEVNQNLISLSDDEILNEESSAGTMVGILQATKDVFLRTAAFDFSGSFFSIRGMDSRYGTVVLNGVEMNKLSDGRPQWSNWGGLNDVLRNQFYTQGTRPSENSFGGILGTTSISSRLTQHYPGSQFSYASSNRSYEHRMMATYASGVRKNGFAYTFSGSRRAGNQGFQEGTSYNAYSFFMGIEKEFNSNHSVGFTGILASNRRGRGAPLTQEVADLKGIRYNEYWGFINGNKVNSRVKVVFEPIVQLSHYWNPSEKMNIQTNIAYQFGKIGNSRVDFNGGSNPSPTYYQKLPSYGLRNKDLLQAYNNLTSFQNSGQMDWNRMYDANITNSISDSPSAYALYEDRNDDSVFTINSILESRPNKNLLLNSKVEFRNLKSHNYAKLLDLLGGTSYLDITNFAENANQAQNNILQPNRLVKEGDLFKYNFELNTTHVNGFFQAQFTYDKIDFYAAGTIGTLTYQRIGFYQNGRFPDHSLGPSEKLNFFNYGIKGGLTYKYTGRHLLDFNMGYFSNAPTLRNVFANSRENNFTIDPLSNESMLSADMSYVFRHPIYNAKLSAYFIDTRNASEISFYYADGLGGDSNAFVQEVVTGIHRRNMGIEFGLEVQATSTLTVKTVAALGQFVYANNPQLYVTSDQSNTTFFDAEFRSKDFTSYLKNYRLANGPQQAYSLGFEYRDPDFWWFGASANLFSGSYIDVAPLTRTSNLYEDSDGLPFLDYDATLAKSLLVQERFADYFTVNLVGGKSWRLGENYISIFASVNNLFNQQFKTGGFEQSRNSNFRELRQDKALEIPVFGNKYWFGRGTNYFININFRK